MGTCSGSVSNGAPLPVPLASEAAAPCLGQVKVLAPPVAKGSSSVTLTADAPPADAAACTTPTRRRSTDHYKTSKLWEVERTMTLGSGRRRMEALCSAMYGRRPKATATDSKYSTGTDAV